MAAGSHRAAQQAGGNAERGIPAGDRCCGKQRAARNADESMQRVPRRIKGGDLYD